MPIASSTAALIAAGVGAAGSIASGVMGSDSASSAADTAASASDRAAQPQNEQFKTVRNDLAPFTGSGQAAMGRLNALFGLGSSGGGSFPAPYTPPAPVAQPQAMLPVGSGVPAGYQFIPPSPMDNGESGTGMNPGILIDAQGNIVSGGATREEAMYRAGLTDSPNGDIINRPVAQPQQVQQAQQSQTIMEPANAGALPGPNSAVTPYAPPNNGVFDPVGGTRFTDPTAFNGNPNYTGNTRFTGATEFKLTPEELAKTPGYKFALEEGKRAIEASAAARGGLLSGGAVKAAIRYATGTADQTYMNQAKVFGENYDRAEGQFNDNYVRDATQFADNYGRSAGQFADNYTRSSNQFGDNYNRQKDTFATNLNASTSLNDQYFTRNISPLFDIAKMGANTAAQTGQIGSDSARAAGGFIQAGGVTQANGQIAASNAVSSGINGAGNNLLYMLGKGAFGGSGGSSNAFAAATDSGGWDY